LSNQETKRLYVIRHAHRDKLLGKKDNGLSEKGKKQAERIETYLEKQKHFKDIKLLSSPKLRCQETLLPVSKRLKHSVKIMHLLDEGGDLFGKAHCFLGWWKKSNTNELAICSHGDWIPMFIDVSCRESVELKKGAIAVLDLKNDKVKLVEVIQELDK